MARLSDLVLDVSTVLRIEHTTVRTIARYLREAGLLSQGGRGSSAASATPLDAARLIIALSVPGHAKNTPQVVEDFGGMTWFASNENGDSPALALGRFLKLPARSTFEAAMAAIIAAYGDEEAIATLEAEGSEHFLPSISCHINCVMLGGAINIRRHSYNFHHPVEDEMNATQFSLRQSAVSEHDRSAFISVSERFQELYDRYFCGIRQTSFISGMELMPIGEMLAGYRDPGEIETDEEYVQRKMTEWSQKGDRA